jgi:methionyl-tRNA formyltransferase
MEPQKECIVIATPYSRNDEIEDEVRVRLPTCEVVRMRDPQKLQTELLEQMAPSWIFFPHWSWIIPKKIHERFRCIIFHMADVPYGRGGSPLQNLIVRGHKETMLTALRCVAGLDAGPVYMKKSFSLEGTAEEILRRASSLVPGMIVELVTKQIDPIPQHGEVVEFQRRTPKDGDIAPLEGLDKVYDFIRMLDADGYPSAFLEVGNFKLEFSAALFNGDEVTARVKIRKKE